MKIKIWNGEGQVVGSCHRNNYHKRKIQAIQAAGRLKHTPEETTAKNTRDILAELNSLIGLKRVKKLIEEIHAFVEIQKKRQKEKLVTEPLVLHMIFKGNPGTGKTTVARILGKLFREVGVLPKGHLVEVERADLVGEFIGHTAQKTREQIKRAMGGILFVDEAYSLARGGEKDFGKEAVDALVKAIEDNRENIVVILAGYQDEMDWFISTNPGLRSRFPIHLDFPDYNIYELLAIADLMLQQRQYVLTNGAREELRFFIEKEQKKHEHSGNARLVRNLIEKAIRRQAVRLLNKKGMLSREDLMSITREDFNSTADGQ